MIKASILIIALIFCTLSVLIAQGRTDYTGYHQSIVRGEELITRKEYTTALSIFENVFNTYDFIFLRDYKVATQLALYAGDQEKAFNFLKSGILGGWTLKEIRKNRFLAHLRNKPEWKVITSQYDSLRSDYGNHERIWISG